MAFTHLALATKDFEATHLFYTEAMGFSLAKVVAGPTPEGGGWSRHVFYDCGDGEMMAFWDLHDASLEGFKTNISKDLGLPTWVNHIAWNAKDEADFTAKLTRWREHGITVAEVDHGFCRSIYTTDPNGIMVEFCWMVRELDQHDAEEAAALLAAEQPEFEAPPTVTIHEPLVPATAAGS
jgi:catechol 2,3-dioxygenase-like lactoylglutathione lyase family enzyme